MLLMSDKLFHHIVGVIINDNAVSCQRLLNTSSQGKKTEIKTPEVISPGVKK
jgi:hypothetical protein